MAQILLDNWPWILVAFFILEKIVKVTPAKWDDIVIDGAKWLIWKITNKQVKTP